ncbi:hypothetical protein FRB95_002562 [Tulasnella sp. JGI-2019a]|nr:hypothetical protein FRB95_002562 [Tulasnella sp. JGI-2019a]
MSKLFAQAEKVWKSIVKTKGRKSTSLDIVLPTNVASIDPPGEMEMEYSQDTGNESERMNQTPDALIRNVSYPHRPDSPAGGIPEYQRSQRRLIERRQQQAKDLDAALADLERYRIPREHLEIDKSFIIGRGGVGDVMRGRVSGYHSEVAIKRLRSNETRDIRVAKRLVQELKMWSTLKHPNILPLIGYYLSETLDIALIVCQLQPHGNIKDYLQRFKPSVLERLQLALDTISAIEYLHKFDPPVIHGNIHGTDVLISNERRAIICDFGLCIALDEVPTGLTSAYGFKCSIRWCSPELITEEHPRRTVYSDLWAWGCLLVEIIRETIPYSQMRDVQALFALTKGVLPESEELLTHPVNIWPIVQGCWHIEPGLRSTAETSARRLRLLDAAMANLERYRIPLEHLEIDQSFEIGRGGFGVVMRAKMLGYHSEVAVKRLKSDETRYICVAKRLVRELKTWSTLKHPNILPLIGFYLSEGLDVALIVCPLLPHGNVKDYLQRFKPSVPERLQLALDTTFAVDYLHNLDPLVIHGDIKGLNVLITNERRAILCDFGLTLARTEGQTDLTTTEGFKGSIRWCSPELITEEKCRRTVSSDMWAWGCLLVEIMRETLPYPSQQNHFKVVLALQNGDPPETQELLTHPLNIWPITQGCWHMNPELRSTASTTAKRLRLLMASLESASHNIPEANVP